MQGNLMAVSELEQELACASHSFGLHFKSLLEVIQDIRTKPAGRLRVALLFALRYEKVCFRPHPNTGSPAKPHVRNANSDGSCVGTVLGV